MRRWDWHDEFALGRQHRGGPDLAVDELRDGLVGHVIVGDAVRDRDSAGVVHGCTE
jgi:hypothetical protein